MTSNYNWEESINLLEYERVLLKQGGGIPNVVNTLQGVNISLIIDYILNYIKEIISAHMLNFSYV